MRSRAIAAAGLLLAVACATALAVQAAGAGQDPFAQTERQTRCYDCHSGASYGNSPPVATFVTFVLPADAGAVIGTPFAYEVGVQNAWTADLTYLEPRLDLTHAPSLAFVSDAPPLHLELPGNLTLDFSKPTAPQQASQTVAVPMGLTHLSIRLQPQDGNPLTGPDLALRIDSGRFNRTIDEHGRGGTEELNLTQRSDFADLGYGNWTVSAVMTLVRADAGLLNSTAPRPSIPFRIVADGGATDTGERILGLASRASLGKAQSSVAVFPLVALRAPGPDETVALEVRANVHYDHPASASAVDDARFTKPADALLHVALVGDRVHVTTDTVAVAAAPIHNGATLATIAEAVGYASAFLMVSSTTTGGMFGKASRRWANGLFGTARRRVAFHNFLSYGLIVAALAHTTLFLVEAAYTWSVGLLWGGAAALCMLGLGVTGALQVPMIRRWSFAAWRWTHYGLAVATFAFMGAHMLLDGAHFGAVQDALHWQDPLVGALS